jgi:hypothetical protein
MKFRTKVVVDAIQYTGDNFEALVFFGYGYKGIDHNNSPLFEIVTPEGRMNARVGDWIVKSFEGKFKVLKPDIFEATHEEVK